MTYKHITFFAALLAIAVMGLSASPVLISSPESEATAGKFGGDAGDFMAPRYYSGVSFDKWFGVVSFVSDMTKNFRERSSFSTEIAQLGVAARFGSVYTGLYYGGNVWKGFGMGSDGGSMFNYVEKKVSGKNIRVYNAMPEYGDGQRDFNLYNEAAVLFGVADMGFRLAYASNYQALKLDNFQVETGANAGFYKDFKTEYGHLNPEIAWGMARDLIPDRGIRPELRLDLDILRFSIEREQYTSTTGTSGATSGKVITRSQNGFTVDINAAMGALTFARVNDLVFEFDFEYGFSMFMYPNNEYSYLSNGKYKVAQIPSGYFNAPIYRDIRENSHRIGPSLGFSWSGDTVDLATGLGLAMTINRSEDTLLEQKTGSPAKLVKNGAELNTTTFTFDPALNAGMKWAVVPNKFFLNAGGIVSFGGLSLEKTESKEYEQDKETASKRATTFKNIFNGASTQLSLGVTLSPVEHLSLQAVCGVDAGNSVNTFSTNNTGFLNFAHILVMVKF